MAAQRPVRALLAHLHSLFQLHSSLSLLVPHFAARFACMQDHS